MSGEIAAMVEEEVTVYISGRMRGIPYHNFPRFFEVEEELYSMSNVTHVFNPARKDVEAGLDSRELPEDFCWMKWHPSGDAEDAFDADVEMIKQCDVVYMLEGWEESDGARMEYFAAKFLGKDIAYESPATEAKNRQVAEFSKLVKNMNPACEPFVDIMLEALSLHTSKSHDYGSGDDPYANVRQSEEFGIPGWKGSLIRANDKIVRLKQFCKSGFLNHEAAEDSMLDLCVYFPIILMLYRQHQERGLSFFTEEEMVEIEGAGII